VIQDPAFSYHI